MIFWEMAKRGTTQPVTARDVAGGRIRIPSSGPTKQLLPGERTESELVLNAKPIGRRRYDPRLCPDRERSGVISVPRAVLEATVTIGDRLPLVRASNGTVYLGERGSKLRIAQWVNDRPDEFNACLKETSLTLADFLETREPRWRSPLRADGYREFSDDLWSRVRLPRPDPVAAGFWPKRGPNWDGVAVVSGPNGVRGVVLVEAKSHTNELQSRCTAEAETSRDTIRRALDATQRYLGVDPSRDWMESYYQAANRLAFLYYLRARLNVPAWLISVYFVGDAFEVAGIPQDCPADETGWHHARHAMHAALGLPANHAFSQFQHDVFLDVQ